MKITIVIHNPHKEIVRYVRNTAEINDVVCETLTRNGIDYTDAIECASWCEQATYGESYNEDDFDNKNFSAYVEDDDE